MKKQRKIAAVLSAAAFLAIYAPGSSFAADGWMQEDGSWVYYKEDGERVREDWIRQGDQHYWMDASGNMVSGGLFQIKDDYYYFGEDGVMVREQWVAIPNPNAEPEEEREETPYEEIMENRIPDEPQNYWYYFQQNGKAYRRSGNKESIQAKTIDGKKYAFDTEGRMLYGWVSDGERQTGENAWEYSDYYFGSPDDGAMQQGWVRLHIIADNVEAEQPGSDYWEEEQDRWFYFNANGKKTRGEEGDCRFKTIDGNKYGFDEYGRMIASWYADPEGITLATSKSEAGTNEETGEVNPYQGTRDYSRQFMYFGSPESGVKYTKGWFKTIPSEYLHKSKYEEDSEYTYYADGDGNICVGEIKTIDGEKYAFDLNGRLITGMVCLGMESGSTSSRIEYVFYSDAAERSGAMPRGPFATEAEFDDLVESYAEDFESGKMRFYYFGGQNGTMLTGKQRLQFGKFGDYYDFMFETKGRLKGSGVFGKRDGRLYKAGKLLKPDEYEKYAIFKQSFETLPEDATEEEKKEFGYRDQDGDGKIEGILTKLTVDEFISEVCNSGIYDEDRKETVWTVRYDPPDVTYYLVASDGDIVKNKKSAVDMDGYKFTVKKEKIQYITVDE